jgi:hypothetical protein
MKSELFWRCLVALHSMPLRQLEAMLPNRKDLEPYFASSDSTEAMQHFQRAHVILPFFSMTCKTADQILLEATRREAREEEKRKREQQEEEEAAPSSEPATSDKGSKKGSKQTIMPPKSASSHIYGKATTERWDKFDVDGALAELDIEEVGEEDPDPVSEAVMEQSEEEIDAALRAKLRDPAIRDQLRQVLGSNSDLMQALGGSEFSDTAGIGLDDIIER